MKIEFPFFKKISNVKEQKQQSVIKTKPIKPDSFERSAFKVFKCGDIYIKGIRVKDVSFKDKDGKAVPGFIMKNAECPNLFYACTNDDIQCEMSVENTENCLFIETLRSYNRSGDIKGAGTELVKFASQMSMQNGHRGRLELMARGAAPFYYKNNFRAKRYTDSFSKNALMDYASRTGNNDIITVHWGTPILELDETGAKALLNNTRLSKQARSRVLYEKTMDFDGQKNNSDIDFCDFGKKFVVQLIDKDYSEQAAVLIGDIESGILIPQSFKNNYPDKYEEKIQEELMYAVKFAQNLYY